MPISFFAAGTEVNGTTGTTLTANIPASIAANDVLICVAGCYDTSSVITMAADWTKLVGLTPGSGFAFAVFWHRYNGVDAPSTTVTFASSSGDRKICGVAAYRGCKTTGNPYNAAGTGATGSDTTAEHTGVTTNVDNCYILLSGGTDFNSTAALPSGYTCRFEDSAASTQNTFRATDACIWLFDKDQGTQGATGNVTVSSITVDFGWSSYMLALQPASTNIALTAAAGSYAITGTAATLKASKRVTAASGTYAITGSAATLRRNLPLTAAAGSYAITGSVAALKLTRVIVAASGTYSISGTAATLNRGRTMIAEAGSYLVSGTSATLLYSGANPILIAASGTYSVVGTAATLRLARTLSASAGSYNIGGSAATLTITPVGGAASLPRYVKPLVLNRGMNK